MSQMYLEEIEQLTLLVFPPPRNLRYRCAVKGFLAGDPTTVLRIEADEEYIDQFMEENDIPPLHSPEPSKRARVLETKCDTEWWRVDKLTSYKVSYRPGTGLDISAVAGTDSDGKYVLYLLIGELDDG